jgi:NADPH:quinone reductase-like Zn-dependent oxidoreductase
MSHVLAELMYYVNRMGPQQWVLVLGAAIIVGVFCLRGFGSRSNY